MEHGGGRSSDEREAARQARQRARSGDEQGIPPGDEDDQGSPASEGNWRRPELRSMSRYGGGMDVYTKRRLVAGGAALAVVLILFLLLGGC